jgi:transposase
MWRATYPFNGALYVFRGKRGDLLKVLWWDGQGLCMFCKRLERGKFLWPPVQDGAVTLSPAQIRLLFAGMDWTQIAARSPAPVRPSIPTENSQKLL